ncbi:MAG: CoA pyrophosphatase [Actinomycetota bacterium]|nr:CoA pyrophosphatase [Actinomycetota bacterium]
MVVSASGSVARGGPQIIPRPKRWQPGGPAPWAHLTDRRLCIDSVVDAISGREPAGVRGSNPTGSEQKAAVLVGLYDEKNPCVVLTRRSQAMRSHTHEVSFPGGRVDPADGTLWATARREAFEEMGLETSHLQFLGRLDPHVTVGSHSIIHPFVAVFPGRPDLTPNPDEVEAIRHVPLGDLLEDDAWREERWETSLGSVTITFFELAGDTVWGATAAMLRQLLALSLGVTDEGYVQNDG